MRINIIFKHKKNIYRYTEIATLIIWRKAVKPAICDDNVFSKFCYALFIAKQGIHGQC
jgi:hypothetical protein